MAVQNKTIKWGIFTSPQTKEVKFERYVIENIKDLKAFKKAFPQVTKFGMYNNMLSCLSEGYTIVATDPHYLTHMPTYCFENTNGSTHVSSINRVELGEIEK